MQNPNSNSDKKDNTNILKNYSHQAQIYANSHQ